MSDPSPSQDRERFSAAVRARSDEYFPFAKRAPQERRIQRHSDGTIIIRFSLWCVGIAFLGMLIGMILSRASYRTEDIGQMVHSTSLSAELLSLLMLLFGFRRRASQGPPIKPTAIDSASQS